MIDRQFFGSQLIEIDEVDSTNIHAQDLLKNQKVLEGAIITANFQTKGRGQMGTSWYSEKGQNLLFSLILTPKALPLEMQFYLSKVVALGIVSFLNEITITNAKIKWPNDIYVGDKKVCGILIENNLRGYCLESSIVGIGLNVNQLDFGVYDDSATSLRLLFGKVMETSLILNKLLNNLEFWYMKLKEGAYQIIDEEYYRKLLFYNKWTHFEVKEKRILRKIIQVNSLGNICLENGDGQTEVYGMKELKFII
jgi:BirA family transcriptional regulator, biotin operon repressor / biotin---[acetyl-CoA-carboxylase] ligase